ncbi:hypothetical protein LUD75_11190 [Epilithonimonas sp. JDS]|uniref:hypothetical protein n=1 Tax=Epilithonimonas sp. JDS TaxID=2902797 RepID=UPI001E467262|nr:hypothetical protein [Epilithonimonas sp. JDS]MCD9855276.1 hypothetical protein [Epilithonimonas sp. JDS]
MKKFIKLSFLIGVLLISGSAVARDIDFSLSFNTVNNKSINFNISNSKNVSLYFYDDSKDELFSEVISKSNSLEKSYNLDKLADGNYYLVAESDNRIEKYKITVKENQVNVDKSPISAITKPEYTINKNFVKLQMKDVVGDVKVSIYDTANNTYYSKNNLAKDGVINLTFDLNPNNAETYIINVEKDGDSFSRMISMK